MKRGWLALVVLVTAAGCSLAVSCSKPVLGCDYRLTVTWQERKSVTEPIPLTTAKVYAFFVNPDEWEVTSIENARAGIAPAVGASSRTRSYDMVAEASGAAGPVSSCGSPPRRSCCWFWIRLIPCWLRATPLASPDWRTCM